MRVGVARKERRDLPLALDMKNRADAVQHAAAQRQQRPKRAQKLALLAPELRHIALAPQPRHIRVAAHDARSGAGRIQQNRIELHALR